MLRSLIFLTILMNILSGCSFVGMDMGISKDPIFEVVILPHHNLTGKRIDIFYQDLQKRFTQFDRIVIISPDHFGLVRSPIESLPDSLDRICYMDSCVRANPLVPYSGTAGIGTDFSFSGITTEHGIGEHITRIHRYFSDALVTPLILRRRLTVGDDEKILADTIANIRDRRVLVIASVDFSHHVREEIARLHDAKSIDTLNSGRDEDFGSLEVDCRNCLGVAKLVAEKKGKDFFHLTDRTSVDILSGSGADIENTSHIFGSFVGTGTRDATGVFLFAGDSHWARGFPYYEQKIKGYREKITSILYQKYDIENDPLTKYHRILSGFDEVIVNWESGIAHSGSCLKSSKTTQMSTDPAVFPYFHMLSITMANIANNHSHDCGTELFDGSFDKFLSGGIIPFGYDHIALREVRGNRYAFIGIDTIDAHLDLDSLKNTIQSLTASGNLVIVSIHWGIEYATGHTLKQAAIAHDLIDAGARLVIGHHPHVVQDSEIYKGVPIYYSIGNFIFDQPFPETLRGLLVGCEVSKIATSCQSVDVFRDPKDYTLHF